MITIDWRDPAKATDRLAMVGFVVEFFAYGVELRRRAFPLYRDALAFAERKAGRNGAVGNNVPEHMRSL